ncbi:MAG: hypothetical protein HY458_01855 [Parcubacteria group bacterium]|nr:hypothetical protein [Parcubacteria group bacterium]
MPQYTQEQFNQIFEKLPDELQEAIFSVETADAIYNARLSQGVTDERGNRVAELTGQVLMGILLPEDFQKTLEKEVGLKKDAAANIARDITRFVFFPVKESLRQLHNITEAANSAAPQVKKAAPAAAAFAQEAPSPATPKKEDTYRESFE